VPLLPLCRAGAVGDGLRVRLCAAITSAGTSCAGGGVRSSRPPPQDMSIGCHIRFHDCSRSWGGCTSR